MRGTVKVNDEIRIRYNSELKIVQQFKAYRLKWLGHVHMMDDEKPAIRCLFEDPIGDRSRGRPTARCM